jgi:hypothetical protein
VARSEDDYTSEDYERGFDDGVVYADKKNVPLFTEYEKQIGDLENRVAHERTVSAWAIKALHNNHKIQDEQYKRIETLILDCCRELGWRVEQ